MRTAYTCAFGDTKSGALPDFQRLPWQSKAAVYGLVPSYQQFQSQLGICITNHLFSILNACMHRFEAIVLLCK